MNYNKYKNSGWGLSREALETIAECIRKINKPDVSILEFGSGHSTRFLLDFKKEFYPSMILESYDNDPKYMHKHPCVRRRELIQYNDKDYESLFTEKIDQSKSRPFDYKKSSRKMNWKNVFYRIQDNDLINKYDLVVLDGPNGNGRSIAFPFLIGKMNPGSYIFIDDVTHYDFVERMTRMFPKAEVVQKYQKGRDVFALVRTG